MRNPEDVKYILEGIRKKRIDYGEELIIKDIEETLRFILFVDLKDKLTYPKIEVKRIDKEYIIKVGKLEYKINKENAYDVMFEILKYYCISPVSQLITYELNQVCIRSNVKKTVIELGSLIFSVIGEYDWEYTKDELEIYRKLIERKDITMCSMYLEFMKLVKTGKADVKMEKDWLDINKVENFVGKEKEEIIMFETKNKNYLIVNSK